MDSEQKSVAYLQRISHASRGPNIEIAGKLNDCALGEIYYARLRNSNDALILKTIELHDQNIWAVVKNTLKTTVRNIHSDSVLYVSELKSDAKLWRDTWAPDQTLSKIVWSFEDIERDGAKKVYKLNEFLNEGLVGLILTKCLKMPHFIKVKGHWIDDDARGNILQDYGGVSMLKNMINLSLDEFKSIVMQSLITLGHCQERLNFKHHDLHLQNIFINELKDQKHNGRLMSESKTWSYKVGPQTLTVPHFNKLCKIGDFGLSSVTDPTTRIRYERLDMQNLDGGEIEWGEWSGHERGLYDAAFFLSQFFMEEAELCPPDCVLWAKSLYNEMRLKFGVKSSNIGRPFRGFEGRQATINDFLGLDIFYEFTNKDIQFLIC